MNKGTFILLVILAFTGPLKAQDTTIAGLCINRGELYTIDSLKLPALFFNADTTFESQNVVIQCELNVPLKLTITNNDTLPHTLAIEPLSLFTLLPNNDTSISLTFIKEEIISIRDTSFNSSYLGLSTLIVATNSTNSSFYWNLNEHDSTISRKCLDNEIIEFTKYQPQYFTINHLSFPETKNDTLSAIKGAVGDTIRINMYNSGLMNHNIHFHGFHAKIISSSEFPLHNGRIKDSFGLNTGESLQLEMVAHQPGSYPIHNHNLGATLGNGLYPKGMVSLIVINP